MPKWLKFGLIAFAVFYVVTQPKSAAGIVDSIINGLKTAAIGFGQFISSLT